MADMTNLIRLLHDSLPYFTALGHPVRQQLLLAMIDERPKSVHELAEGTNLTRPTISHHLKVMRQAGMVVAVRRGRNSYYHPVAGRGFDIIKDLVAEADRVITLNEGKA